MARNRESAREHGASIPASSPPLSTLTMPSVRRHRERLDTLAHGRDRAHQVLLQPQHHVACVGVGFSPGHGSALLGLGDKGVCMRPGLSGDGVLSDECGGAVARLAEQPLSLFLSMMKRALRLLL